MEYSVEQLVHSFKNAKSPVSQIRILADLNSTSKFEIERVLREAMGDDVVTGILGRKAQNPKAKVGEAMEKAAQIICERQERKFQSLERETRERAYALVAKGGSYPEFLMVTGLYDRRQSYRSWSNLRVKARHEGALG